MRWNTGGQPEQQYKAESDREATQKRIARLMIGRNMTYDEARRKVEYEDMHPVRTRR